MYFFVKLLKGDMKTVNVLLLGMSLSLLLLSQVIGLLIAYVFVSLLLLCLSIPFKKGFFVLAVIIPMTFLLWNAKYFEFLPLLVLYGIGLVLITKRTVFSSKLQIWKALTVAIPILPTAFYLYMIGKLTGIWGYGAIVSSSFQSAYDFLRALTANSQSSLTFMEVARLDNIFFRFSFVSLLLIFLVGLILVVRKRESTTGFLLIIFLMFLIIFLEQPRMFYPSLSPDVGYVRRYLYIIPVVSILASEGFEWLYQRWGSIKTRNVKRPFFIASIVLYCSLSTFFILERSNNAWPRPLSSLAAVSELQTSLGANYATAFDFAVLASILLICLEFPKLFSLAKTRLKTERIGKWSSLFLALIVCSSFLIVYSLRSPLEGIAVNGGSSRLALPSDAQELVNYFNELNDSGVVIGFSKYFLVTFSNRVIIDLSMPSCVIHFKEIFQNASSPELLQILNSRDIKYVIEPKSQQMTEFRIFGSFKTEFPSFRNLLNSSHVTLDKSLTNFNVYKILSPNEYDEYIQKLGYYYNYQNNPIIISGDNQSALFKTSIEKLTLTDDTQFKIKGNNALKISISSLEQTTGIDNSLSSSLDFNGEEFVSFYWFGNSSNIPITIRFQTGSWKDQFSYKFVDSWSGWARLIIPLTEFSVQAGSPHWANVTLAAFVFEGKIEKPATFYLDEVTVDSGIADYHFISSQSLLR